MTGRGDPTTPVWLVVCGERERGDDAAGPLAVEGLPLDLLARCEVRITAGLSVETILDIPPGAACVLVDAARRDRAGRRGRPSAGDPRRARR